MDAAEEEEQQSAAGRKPFRRFFYRGYEVHKLLDLTHAELMQLMHARARRRFLKGNIGGKLLKRLRKAVRQTAAEPSRPLLSAGTLTERALCVLLCVD